MSFLRKKTFLKAEVVVVEFKEIMQIKEEEAEEIEIEEVEEATD